MVFNHNNLGLHKINNIQTFSLSTERESSLLRGNLMTNIIAFCYRCKKNEEVTDLEIRTDGVVFTLKCGYTMRKFWRPDV